MVTVLLLHCVGTVLFYYFWVLTFISLFLDIRSMSYICRLFSQFYSINCIIFKFPIHYVVFLFVISLSLIFPTVVFFFLLLCYFLFSVVKLFISVTSNLVEIQKLISSTEITDLVKCFYYVFIIFTFLIYKCCVCYFFNDSVIIQERIFIIFIFNKNLR